MGGTNPKPIKAIKSWFSKEMDEKRAKGMYFWCDERCSPTHKCPKKQLYMIEAREVDQEEIEEVEELENFDESNPDLDPCFDLFT